MTKEETASHATSVLGSVVRIESKAIFRARMYEQKEVVVIFENKCAEAGVNMVRSGAADELHKILDEPNTRFL